MEIITHLDQVLPLTGDLGLFQLLYIAILCLITIPASFQTLIIYFVAHNPSWRCHANSTTCTFPDEVTSSDVARYRQRCRSDWVRSDWEFVKDDQYSIVTEFDLFCERENLIFVSKSMFFAGMAVGAVFVGFLGDKYGRSKVMKPATIVSMLIAFLSAFSPNFWVFAFSRFLLGLLAPGTIAMFFVVTSEMTGPRFRPLAGIVLWFFFTVGLVIVGLVAMKIQTWKMLMVYSTAPYFVVLPLIFCLPESLRWLYVNNHMKESRQLIDRMAQINGRQKPHIYLAPPKPLKDKVNPLLLFSSSSMSFRSLNIGFAWLVNGLVYYGVTFSSKNLTDNFYRNFILSSLVEFPAAIIAVVASMYLGRKRTTQIPMFLGGLFCALVATISVDTTDQHLLNTRLTFGLLGKFFITLAFDAIYTWTVELYPTQIRTEAMGYVQITSRLGAMLSPWVAEGLKKVTPVAPFVVMGVLSIIVSVLLHFLPETKDTKTADFLENDVKVEGKFGLSKRRKRRPPELQLRPEKQKLSLVEEEPEEEEIA